MKFKFLLILSFLISKSLFSQNSQTLKVKYPGDFGDQYLKLAYFLGEKQYVPIDSVKQVEGSFTFSSKDNEPFKGGLYMLYFEQSDFDDFIISGTEDNVILEADPNDFIKTVKFTNSKENDKFFKFRRLIVEKNEEAKNIKNDSNLSNDEKQKRLQEISDDVFKFANNLTSSDPGLFANKLILAGMDVNVPKEVYEQQKSDSLAVYRYYKEHFFDNLDFSDSRMIRTTYLQEKINRYFDRLVLMQKDSITKESDMVLKLSKQDKEVYRYVLWNITNNYENSPVVGLDGVFIYLVENYYLKDANWLTDDQKQQFQDRLNTLKPLETGKVFPKLVLINQEGKPVDLSTINSKYTIVNFYSPDCSHCKKAAPELEQFYESHKDNFAIYNASVAYKKEEWLSFIKDYNMQNLINVWDAEGQYDFKKEFDVLVTPTLYLLNDKKEIIAKRIQIAELDEFIKYYERK